MVRVARERIDHLFALAEQEALAGEADLPSRYAGLARRIGMRYNVRLAPEYRELYCRGCTVYWVEGRTVRTRLRAGRRVRTCLRCGRTRRVPLRAGRRGGPRAAEEPIDPARERSPGLTAPVEVDEGRPDAEESEDE